MKSFSVFNLTLQEKKIGGIEDPWDSDNTNTSKTKTNNFKKGKENLIKKNILDTERVQRDLKNPTSDSFGPPEGPKTFPETDASKEAEKRLNKNTTKTNTTKTNTTKTNTTKVDVKTRMSDAFDRNKEVIPKKNQIVNNVDTNKINTNKINTNTNQRVIDINKKLASNKINTNINTTVPKPNFGNVTNINVNKGVKLPDFKPRSGTETILTQNQIQSRLDDIQNKNFEKLKRQNANNILKNLDTSDTDKLIPDKNVGRGTVVKPGDPIPDTKIKGGVKSYRDFMKNVKNVNKVVKRTSPYLKGLTRVAVPVVTALQAKGTYDASRRAGMSKQRSLGRTLARGAGQIIGSAIGGTAGAIGGGGVGSLVTGGLGAAAGFDVGGSLATKAFDTFTTRSGRRQFGKSFSNFRKDLMNVDTNTLKKVNNQLNKK